MDHTNSTGDSPSPRMSDGDLRRRTTISAEGQVIGEVCALVFDSSAWRVESLQVKLRKEIADRLGVDRSVFRAAGIEIPVRMVQAVGDTVVLSIAVDGLREMLVSDGGPPPTVPTGDEAR